MICAMKDLHWRCQMKAFCQTWSDHSFHTTIFDYPLCDQGDAEAFAITARASAEAEGMNMKAEAFREYKKAAKVKILKITPKYFQLIHSQPQLLTIPNLKSKSVVQIGT